ncbi:amino acid adenylation domain-containing protein [Streptomyces sp. NPDC088789]|uniref:amino acid adenylation domain-containing protein n=1 Tax=Streptomyces sp. NPDC088789 TaxID=3365899 RepID=UPI003809DA86
MASSLSDLLAAAAAVLSRRTGHDSLVLDFVVTDSAGSRSGRGRFAIDDSTTFAELTEVAEKVLSGDAQPGSESDHPADARANLTSGGPGPAAIDLVDDAGVSVTGTLQQQLRAALVHGSAAPETEVAALNLMQPTELSRMIAWGTGPAEPTVVVPVHELVTARAIDAADTIALRDAEGSLTYAALVAHADAVAADLIERGVVPDAVVGVLLNRSVNLVVTLLGVLKAGGAYLALDPADPPTRHAELLTRTGVKLLVTDREHATNVPTGLEIVWVDEAVGAANAPDAPPAARGQQAAPHHLAYISFTSGSTGEPRPVAVPHRAVSRLVQKPAWIDVRPSDVFLQLSPVAFDASTFELWAPLASGATLVIAPAGTVDVAELAKLVRRAGITVLWLTAGLFHALAAAHPDAFAGVRHLIAGGDVVAPEPVRRVMAAHRGLTFTNGYGPTENTTFTACWTTREVPPPDADRIPIGRPIDGTGVRVLDRVLRPVPVGVSGDLYAVGAGLANGYLADREATEERFLVHPETGERMYRTGDVVRWREDGNLDYLGRSDRQVKIRGYRVEPGVVEARLLAHPEIHQAAVVPQDDGTGGRRLLAYVTTHRGIEDHGAFAARIREELATGLPAYLVPWTVLVRDELLLNQNGKLDRQSVPAIGRVPRNVWNDFVAPRSAQEARLTALWGEMLGVEPVGVTDDFFDLGGHSILAAQLIERVHREFEVDLPARMLYTQPTVAELAENVRQLPRTTGS